MAVFPRLVGWIRSTDILWKWIVADSTPTERTVYDSDGYLYQLGTKLTTPAASFNDAATKTGSETLSNKILDNATNTWAQTPHDYAGAAVDWTLSAAELLLPMFKPTNASGACNAIIPHTRKVPYWFTNITGQALTVKGASGSSIVIASTKTACVMSDGTNVIRLTTDA